MQNILIVSEEKNHLVLSIKGHLKEISYEGIVVPADTTLLNEIKETPLAGIVVNADWETIKQKAALDLVKDRAIHEGVPIFTIGQKDALQVLKLILSERLVKHEFVRPLHDHVSKVALKMDSLIKRFNTQKKILLVDDSGAMLRVLKSWLGDKYNVSAVNSGAMAIKFLALNKPDLILLDYDMPVVDGKQVLQMIRSEADFADIPVIFLTAKGDKESIMNVQSLKPEGYLLKTLESSQIIDAIDKFFQERRLQ
jgi:CheY-like chemotaxis protein